VGNETFSKGELVWVYNKNLDFIKRVGGCSVLEIVSVEEKNGVSYIAVKHTESGNSINLLLEDFNILWFSRNPESWDSRG
jgi:outer membrane lipoprotein-sorting protein